MSKDASEKRASVTPLAVGTGLLALDEVIGIDRTPIRHWAGGTCGNVLIALRYLGWASKPIARLEPCDATKMILADLRRWGVAKELIRVEPTGSTPIIVQRNSRNANGTLRHSFSWRCPDCGAPFSGYKPELASVAEQLIPKVHSAQLFFFDRVSAGAIVLAKAAAESGALIVFEPSGIGNPVQFKQAWEVAHVVKYSHERLSELPEMDVSNSPELVIETLGDAGLRYRRWKNGQAAGPWIESKAIPIDDFKDSAGAGDWCTAGILSKIASSGQRGFRRSTDKQLAEAVRYGQALAAWCCRFEGARGGMYAVKKDLFTKQVNEILSGIPIQLPLERSKVLKLKNSSGFCRRCDLNGAQVNAKARS